MSSGRLLCYLSDSCSISADVVKSLFIASMQFESSWEITFTIAFVGKGIVLEKSIHAPLLILVLFANVILKAKNLRGDEMTGAM